MAYGFLALNTSGQVLVSSETRNLHFVGKALLNRTIASFDAHGGLRHWAFRINCNATPVPFFSMPADAYYAISAVNEVSTGVWEIEVIRSGTSATTPEIYVFSDPRGATASGTNYGMRVMRDDGTPSFDSRLGPLVVTGGIMVNPPSGPMTTTPGGVSAHFCESAPAWAPDTSNQYPLTGLGGKPLFFYPSLAQSEREVVTSDHNEQCDGLWVYGSCAGTLVTKDWVSRYWAFFRGGIRYAGDTLFCGWIALIAGCNWAYQENQNGFFDGDGDTSNSTAGTSPYSNETLNLSAIAVIVTDGDRYD